MTSPLLLTLLRIAQLQGQSVDRLALAAAVDAASNVGSPHEAKAALSQIAKQIQAPQPKLWGTQQNPDLVHLPYVIWSVERGWGVLRGQNAQGQWVSEWPDMANNRWTEEQSQDLQGLAHFKLNLARNYDASHSSVFKLVRGAVLEHKKILAEIAIGGVLINLIALATSLYSMQVYDRVVPTGAGQTLLALTIGVTLAIVFEFALKWAKSHMQEELVDKIDGQLSRDVYSRFLAVRLDQLPASVGSLASQMRGYETVRGFLTTIPVQLLIDMPFMVFYTVVVALIAGWVGLVPVLFIFVSLSLGLYYKRKVEALTLKSNASANLKTGLLVESVEGAETIKSGQGGWRMLMNWMRVSDEARATELESRHVQEHSQYWIASLHQLSYVGIVASGALMISAGNLTMGGLIACTILSGRILGPISALPNMLIQWGHTRAALQGLDRLWSLQTDHHDIDHPVVLDSVQGQFELENVQANYGNNKALLINKLAIRPGERIGVMGPVGAGKTTLLRLLSGMYKPQAGHVKLDGVDISHISKPVLAQQIGYLQQEGRLFAGTLRDNLVLGMMDPGDQAILDAAKKTGLAQAVLSRHPLGLMQPISEGGQGLSGGQRQLTNLTRVFLRQPRIWLLDEPTASLDKQLELWVMMALRQTLRKEDTFVVVTHKPELLELVDRVIVVAQNQVVMDGPKAEVLAKLQSGGRPAQQGTSAIAGAGSRVASQLTKEGTPNA